MPLYREKPLGPLKGRVNTLDYKQCIDLPL